MADNSAILRDELYKVLLASLRAGEDKAVANALNYLKQFPPQETTVEAEEMSAILAKYDTKGTTKQSGKGVKSSVHW